jgi:hypothetical protein
MDERRLSLTAVHLLRKYYQRGLRGLRGVRREFRALLNELLAECRKQMERLPPEQRRQLGIRQIRVS